MDLPMKIPPTLEGLEESVASKIGTLTGLYRGSPLLQVLYSFSEVEMQALALNFRSLPNLHGHPSNYN